MSKQWTWIILAVLLIAAVGISVFAYPRMPERVVSHWNAQGQPDDTIGRFWGVALFPVVMLIATLLMLVIPLIDPLRSNIEKFRPTYHLFIVIFNVYFLYIHILTVIWNLGVHYELNLALIPAMAVLFFLIGLLLGRAKRNWFIGIRTPWTMSSDFVWERTHQRGALLFKIAAVIILFGLLLPNMLLFIMLVPILLIIIYLVVYSYVLYRQSAE
jgi:uncharacterized membrane protein